MTLVLTQPGHTVDWMPGAGPFDVPGDFYLVTTGAANSRATTPDTGALDITGDIDIRIDLRLDDWLPAAGTNFELIGKRVISGNQKSWLIYVRGDGKVALRWSADGSTDIDATSTTSLPVRPGERLAIRATLDVDNGASGKTATFYTAPAIIGPWTQLGSSVTTASTTSIFNSTAPLEIGDVVGSGFLPSAGRVYAAEVRSGIGGTVAANPDFTAQAPGTTAFTDGAGRVWTVASPASIQGFAREQIPGSDVKSIEIRDGRDNELDVFPAASATVALRNNDRRYDPEHTTGPHFGDLLPRTPFRLRFQAPGVALRLPGTTGATASTPDHSSFAITDLDIRVHVAMADWTPGGLGQRIVDQDGGAGQVGWALVMPTAGTPQLIFTTNGSSALTRTATTATGFVDGTAHWLRVTLDADDGAGNHDVTFYTSSDGDTWTQLGAVVQTAGTVTPWNSTAAIKVGGAVTELVGEVRYFELRSGIEEVGGSYTVVANPDFAEQIPGSGNFTDSTGKVWTLNVGASLGFGTERDYDWFHGFVRSGWRQGYRKSLVSTCTVDLEDLLGVIEQEPLPVTAYDTVVLAGQPRAFWKLDESDGTQMLDSSGNGFHGERDNGEPADSLVFGGVKGFLAPHVGDNRGIFKGQGLPLEPPVTMVGWIKTPRDLTKIKDIINVQRDNANGSSLTLKIETSGGGSPNGELVIAFRGLGDGYTARGNMRVDDDEIHMVAVTIASTSAADVKLYVDGVEQTKTTIFGTVGGNWSGHLWWTVGNSADTTSGDFGLDGIIDEVAIYDRALDAAEIADLYEAGTSAFSGDFSGERVNRVLDFLGIPAAMRDIAQGDTTVGPATYNGANAGSYIQKIVESEQGVLFVDHRNGGVLKFRGRYHRLTETRSTTSRATFTAKHFREDCVPEPNGVDSIVNVVDVDWRGGTETVTDETSLRAYGPRSRSLTTEAPTPVAAQSAGNWMIARYKDPQTRLRHLPLNLAGKPELWPTVLGLRTSDRITVQRHPQKVGATVSNQLIIEGTTLQMHDDGSWTVDYQLSNADDTTVWIWGTSMWGASTVWG